MMAIGSKSLNMAQARLIKEDSKLLLRMRPTMDWVETWKVIIDFVDKFGEVLTDAAPLNNAARAIVKQCQKQQKKQQKKKGPKAARIA